MSDLTRWQYFLIRWVPVPARGEYVNIAACVFNTTTEDGILFQRSGFKRANRLGAMPEGLDEVLDNFMSRLLTGEPSARDSIVKQMRHDHRNVLQISEPMPMAVASADEGMGFIFPKLVGDE